MRFRAASQLLLAGVAASALCCGPREPSAPGAEAATTATPASAEHAGSVLPFIEDDYPRALSAARERQVPVFVEAWAPW